MRGVGSRQRALVPAGSPEGCDLIVTAKGTITKNGPVFSPDRLLENFRNAECSEQSGLLESMKRAVLVDDLEGAAAELELHKGAELGNPNALGLKVR